MWDAFGEYEEIVHIGSFAESLARADLDVPLVIDHVSSRRIARTTVPAAPLSLTEVTTGDRTGLRVLAPALDRADPDVQYIVPKLRSGLIDEMSFRFLITSGRWSDDYTQFHIHAADIHRGDVSIVGYGASPHTAGSGLRGARALGDLSDDELRAELDRRSGGPVPDQRDAARAAVLRILG
jgi:HK97 family phage prohead protease